MVESCHGLCALGQSLTNELRNVVNDAVLLYVGLSCCFFKKAL